MIILNLESDELLMSICMKVKKTKYWAVFPKGTRYHLTERYRVNGRFSRKSVELYFAKKKLLLDESYTIEVTEDYEGKEELALFLIKKQIRKLYAMAKADVINFWLGPSSIDIPNFRFKSAVTQPYKSDRAEKPAIREMLREWLIQTQGAQIAHGYEADDMLGIHQGNETVIDGYVDEFGIGQNTLVSGTIACHVDKDICQIPGWHYNTDSDSLYYVTDPGELTLSSDRSSLKGTGLAFFYAQMLMGDRTDTIPSLKSGKYGAVGVYKLLQDCKEEYDYLTVIVEEFQKVMGDKWKDRLLEQADLVWICRKQGETGSVYISNKLKEYGI